MKFVGGLLKTAAPLRKKAVIQKSVEDDKPKALMPTNGVGAGDSTGGGIAGS